MNHEKPSREHDPGAEGVEVLQRPKPDDDDSREQNGTGADADEAQLGVTDEELTELEDDSEGG